VEVNVTTRLGFDECYDEMISLSLILMCVCVQHGQVTGTKRDGAERYLGVVFINTGQPGLLENRKQASFSDHFNINVSTFYPLIISK